MVPERQRGFGEAGNVGHRDPCFDEARANGDGTVGWFVVRINDTTRAAEIARAIDERFANSAFESRTATEAERARQFANQLGNIGLMMTGILGAVFFTILLLTGNTMTGMPPGRLGFSHHRTPKAAAPAAPPPTIQARRLRRNGVPLISAGISTVTAEGRSR